MFKKGIKIKINNIIRGYKMKKIVSLFLLGLSIMLVSAHNLSANATTYYTVNAKAPYVSPSMKPIIAKYRQQNYVGALQDLEDLVITEKNNTLAKYYLALCYTRLGYEAQAKKYYQMIIDEEKNEALTYYSKRALDCIGNPDSEQCSPKKQEQEQVEVSDIEKFIQSGKKIHPSASDRITKDRMERRIQQEEYLKKQQEKDNANLKSDNSTPTKEEIMAAINTLSKIGLNPYSQNNLATNQLLGLLNNQNQYSQFGFLNQNQINPLLLQTQGMSQDAAKMLLYSQLTNSQNSLMNYGM